MSVEAENKYITYYIVKPKNGAGWLVKALNGQQAIAKILRHYFKPYPYFSVKQWDTEYNNQQGE